MRLAGAALIAASLAVAGCATSLRTTRDLTLSPEAVMDLVRRRIDAVSTIRGEGVVSIESPEESGSSSFTLSLKKPDSILVNLSGPFGVRLGTLQFTRSRFVFYNYQDNYAFVGTSDGSTLHSMFNLRMSFDQVMRAFTGEFFAPGEAAPDSFSTDGESYVFTYRADGGRAEYRVDGQDYFVRSYRVIDSAGSATLTATAAEPEEDDGLVTPRLLRVVFPRERRSLSVAYSEIELNREADCRFTLPKSADIFHR